MNAIADIRMRIEHGASVNEVISAYEAHEFPELEKVESQMAMIKAVERVGQSATVHEVLQEECMGKKEIDLQNVGFKALISTIKKESFKVDEVITQFQPDDFEEEVVQDRLGQLVTEAQQLDTAQVNPQTTQLANANEQLVTQVFHGPNQYRYKSFNLKQKHYLNPIAHFISFVFCRNLKLYRRQGKFLSNKRKFTLALQNLR